MGVEKCFQVSEEVRNAFIEEFLRYLPEKVRDSAKQRAIKIVEDYVGQDVNALSVLAYAAEKGRFDEFAAKLEAHYQENLKYVHPEARRNAQVPGAVRAERFFLECYQALGVNFGGIKQFWY